MEHGDLFGADKAENGHAVPVLVPLPLPGPLHYRAPEGLAPGTYVAVTVSGRETLGVIWDDDGALSPDRTLKPVERTLPYAPMRAEVRRFLDLAARYTLTPPGMMLRLATRAPGLLDDPKTRTGFLRGPAEPAPLTDARRRVLEEVERAETPRTPGDLAEAAGVSPGVIRGLAEAGALRMVSIPADPPPPRLDAAFRVPKLNADQERAAAAMRDSLAARRYTAFLLEGVTGSGKTETYMEAVALALESGRQSLILLPEIALTEEFMSRMRKRFGAPPLAWHSGLTPAARRRVWRAVETGIAKVVAGARSALFLPYRDLALTVVDEEHDSSFKQDDQVLYHARDLAVLRASSENGTVVLASATPSLESWQNAQTGKYRRLSLPNRHGRATLPHIGIVDLRVDPPERGRWLSPRLCDAAAETVSRGEQVLLFLNRRGYAPLTLCRNCGWRSGCVQCSAWLVEHRTLGCLICHQCGHRERVPEHCPECGGADRLAACGPGVERIAEEAAERFPLARIVTLSSDLTGDPKLLQAELQRVARGEADIVVGTQIVAKGHHFPKLTLSAIVDADLGLGGGDLRASERSFQLINQVAGRAGREDRPGRALLQTAQPDHPVFRAILGGDGQAFRERLADERERARMPPFARLIGVIVQGEDEAAVWDGARLLAHQSETLTSAGVDLFGPAPAPYALLRGRYRVRLLLRMPKSLDHTRLVPRWRDLATLPKGVRAIFDVDPQSFL